MHVFIAGAMQGVRTDHLIDSQDYRSLITEALQKHVPEVKITDPFAHHPESVTYTQDQARQTFRHYTAAAADVDVLIAYLPCMSMGTAMEMWSAFCAGRYIIAVTPFVHHWAILATANEILPDLDALMSYIESGRLGKVLAGGRPANEFAG
jgi:hypothetical protein